MKVAGAAPVVACSAARVGSQWGPVGSSIKPPGAGSPDAIDAADAAGAAETLSEAEQSASAKGADAPEGAGATQGGTEAWIARLDAGEVTREQAVDGIVAEALEAHGGSQLDPARRSELEGVLRDALQDDPVLGVWLGGREG